jgi:hypothetical protein
VDSCEKNGNFIEKDVLRILIVTRNFGNTNLFFSRHHGCHAKTDGAGEPAKSAEGSWSEMRNASDCSLPVVNFFYENLPCAEIRF